MADTFLNPIDIPELNSTPSAPPVGYIRIYSKSDKKIYCIDSNGTETEMTNTNSATVSNTNYFNVDGGSPSSFPRTYPLINGVFRIDFGSAV